MYLLPKNGDGAWRLDLELDGAKAVLEEIPVGASRVLRLRVAASQASEELLERIALLIGDGLLEPAYSEKGWLVYRISNCHTRNEILKKLRSKRIVVEEVIRDAAIEDPPVDEPVVREEEEEERSPAAARVSKRPSRLASWWQRYRKTLLVHLLALSIAAGIVIEPRHTLTEELLWFPGGLLIIWVWVAPALLGIYVGIWWVAYGLYRSVDVLFSLLAFVVLWPFRKLLSRPEPTLKEVLNPGQK